MKFRYFTENIIIIRSIICIQFYLSMNIHKYTRSYVYCNIKVIKIHAFNVKMIEK